MSNKKKYKSSKKQNTTTGFNVTLSSGHVLEFLIEQIVYLKTDKEQKPRLVTGIQLRPNNSVTYGLTEETNETWHYGFEISNDRDIIMATCN